MTGGPISREDVAVSSVGLEKNEGSSNDTTIEQSAANRLSQCLPLATSGSCVCRICHTNNSKEPLISPCRCKGSLAYVHLSCLERWLNQSCRSHCELCRYHFNAIETLRYGWSESLRIWISHPRNRRHVQSDLLILTLLTVVTVGLVTVCILGMRYFVIEGRKIGVSRLWTRGSISFFLTIVVLGYVTTVYLLAKHQLYSFTGHVCMGNFFKDHMVLGNSLTRNIPQDQVSPWYRWWKSTVNVRLVTERQEQSRHSRSTTSGNSVNEESLESVAIGGNGVNGELRNPVTNPVSIDRVSRCSID